MKVEHNADMSSFNQPNHSPEMLTLECPSRTQVVEKTQAQSQSTQQLVEAEAVTAENLHLKRSGNTWEPLTPPQ